LSRPAQIEPSPRISVTFSPEIYASLERIAKKKKVSLAWVIRDAVERYVADEAPLFAERRNG
jgi:predicted transcriptional regulator